MSAEAIDRLIAVGGCCEVYLVCRGGSGPTVVFEAALGEDHASWLPIAERLAEGGTGACIYDGWGRAEPPNRAVRQRLTTTSVSSTRCSSWPRCRGP